LAAATAISRVGAICAIRPPSLRNQAAEAHNNRTAAYLIGTPMFADYLEEAMAMFGLSPEDFEESI